MRHVGNGGRRVSNGGRRVSNGGRHVSNEAAAQGWTLKGLEWIASRTFSLLISSVQPFGHLQALPYCPKQPECTS